MDPQNQSSDSSTLITAEIRTFLESLLTDAGMNAMEDDMKEEMVKELYARLDSYISAAIVEKLPVEKLEEFITMNEEKKPQAEIDAYLKANIENVDQFFAEIFMEFRGTYLGNVVLAKQAGSEDTVKEDNTNKPN